MRRIGGLDDERGALTFADYLFAQGIEGEVRPEPDGTWGLWVYSESQVEQGKELFARYRENPDDPIYHGAAGEAQRRMAEREKEVAAMQARTYDRDRLWAGGAGGKLGPLTSALILVSIGVAVFSRLGADPGAVAGWFITHIERIPGYIQWQPGLAEVRHGQVWRLITPIFLHFGIWHILFNMLWTRDLGGMIERARGTLFLGLFIVVTAAVSNLAQFYVSGPAFGGMSGVVYAMAGYARMKGKYDPDSRLYLPPQTMTMLIIWFFVCLTGLLGPIANVAHGVGLVAGLVWGYLAGRFARHA